MRTLLGKGLGVLIVLLTAWCILYPALCRLGVERFGWDHLWLGCLGAVFAVIAYCGRLAGKFVRQALLPANERARQEPGFKAGLFEGVRIAAVAVAVCTVLGLGLFFLDRWYMKT